MLLKKCQIQSDFSVFTLKSCLETAFKKIVVCKDWIHLFHECWPIDLHFRSYEWNVANLRKIWHQPKSRQLAWQPSRHFPSIDWLAYFRQLSHTKKLSQHEKKKPGEIIFTLSLVWAHLNGCQMVYFRSLPNPAENAPTSGRHLLPGKAAVTFRLSRPSRKTRAK